MLVTIVEIIDCGVVFIILFKFKVISIKVHDVTNAKDFH